MELQEITIYHKNPDELETLAKFLVDTYNLKDFVYDAGNNDTSRPPSFFFLCDNMVAGEILISILKLSGVHVKRVRVEQNG
jgi:hypothetical protein